MQDEQEQEFDKILLVTTYKMSNTVITRILSMLFEKLNFEKGLVINQSLACLYACQSPTAIIVNLGEKVTVTPYCNGNLNLLLVDPV